MKALLVEDDPDLRDLVEVLLAERGHEVSAFRDAESAWELYQQEHCPLVVLDWGLPGMDGRELCRRIRRFPGGEASAILMMTGRTGPNDLAAVLDSGASDYLPKPFDLDLISVRLTIAERHAEMLGERARAEAERATLLEREQAARAQAERARERAALLAETSNRLAASLSYEATLSDVVHLLVPALADRCGVYLVEQDGALRCVAAAPSEPVGPADPSIARALETGQTVVSPDDARSPPGGEPVRMSVPMRARERVVGVMWFEWTRAGERSRADEQALAEDLAGRAAGAVDNAQLYQAARLANRRVRTLVESATEAQTAEDEVGVLAAVGAALQQVGLDGYLAILESEPGGEPRLVIRHVVLSDPALLPSIERALGRPVVGITLDPERSMVGLAGTTEGRAILVPDAGRWLRETLAGLESWPSGTPDGLRALGRGICAPVTDGRTVLGVLSVWGPSLDEADVSALELLGRVAGGALAAQRLRALDRERARLDGALLLARTAAHELSTALGLATGYTDLLATHPAVAGDPVLSEYVREAQHGAAEAARTLARLQHVMRLEETPSPLGADKQVLDLDRSTSPPSP